jgi:hypothetical protein
MMMMFWFGLFGRMPLATTMKLLVLDDDDD